MTLEKLDTKCSGLEVLTSVPLNNRPLEVHTTESIESIYKLYKDCITNFGPNLNQSQVLLYVYKLFFNVKNESLTQEYSSWVN